MSKEFKNIDDLFKSTIGQGTAKAPKALKANIMNATGGGNLWLIGAILLLATAVGAIAVTLNMSDQKLAANYEPRQTEALANLNNAHSNANKTINDQPLSNSKNEHAPFAKNRLKELNKSSKNTTENKQSADKKQASETLETPNETIRESEASQKNQTKAAKGAESNNKALLKSNKQPAQKNNSAQKAVEMYTKTETKRQLATIEKESPAAKQLTEENKAVLTKEPTKPKEQAALPAKVAIEKNEQNVNIGHSETEPAKKEVVETTKEVVEQQQNSLQQIEQTTKLPETSSESRSNKAEAEDTAIAVDNYDSKAINTKNKIETEPSLTTDLPARGAVEIETSSQPKKGYWVVGAHLAPNINMASYGSSPTSDSLSKYNTEKLGFQTQVYGQYTTNSNLSFGAGLGYEQQSYRTTLVTNNFIYDIVENTVFSNYVFDDSTGAITDTIFTTENDTLGASINGVNSSSGNNQLQYLQVPLKLGYQIELNKWLLGADIGVQLNYLLNARGSYVANNEITGLSDMGILKRTTINYQIGAIARYNIVNNLYLSGAVRFTPSFQNYFKADFGTRSVSTISLGIGLAVKF